MLSRISFSFALYIVALWGLASASAQEKPKPPTEADYYKLIAVPIPEYIVLEVGGIELMPDGKLAVCTRRGEIYMISNAFSDSPGEVDYKLFASGLHETLGLVHRDGWLYCTQRCEVTRMKDEDGDGRADLFETVSDGWGMTGDYHEYAFGSRFDKEGNIWVVLCLTGSFTSDAKYRGWGMRVTPDGRTIPTCSGIRSPGGIGLNAEGEMFYTDNQGPWNGTCSLKHMRPGDFLGHPIGNKWYSLTEALGPKPEEPKSGSRIMVEAPRIPQYRPPAIYFPYKKMGQSAAGIVADTSGGKFGPFANQVFVGDQTNSTVMRCYLEKVQDHYQGACFPFREGLDSGALAMLMTADGSMFVGCTNRGWGSRGTKGQALHRIVWTGKVPFEIHEMRAKKDGFELTFTEPVDPATAADVKSYTMDTYTYIFQAAYGSPEVDQTKPTIEKAVVAADKMSVRLYVNSLQEGHIHELQAAGVRSAAGAPLVHKEAYYSLNYIPK